MTITREVEPIVTTMPSRIPFDSNEFDTIRRIDARDVDVLREINDPDTEHDIRRFDNESPASTPTQTEPTFAYTHEELLYAIEVHNRTHPDNKVNMALVTSVRDAFPEELVANSVNFADELCAEQTVRTVALIQGYVRAQEAYAR